MSLNLRADSQVALTHEEMDGNLSFLDNKIDLTNQDVTAIDTRVTSLEAKAVQTVSTFDIFGDGSAVALYQMDGNAKDTGGAYNGTATDVTYDSGKFGNAGVFNGSSSRVDLISLYKDTNMSWSMWFNPSDVPTTTNWPEDYRELLIVNNNDGSGNYSNLLRTVGNNIEFGLCSGSGSLIDNIISNSTITANTWYHIVAVFDSASSVSTLYINGVSDTSKTLTTSGSNQPSDILMLGSRGNTDAKFNGSIDQVRIFNRALTSDEVNTLYNEGQ